jgi:hypothetical protein
MTDRKRAAEQFEEFFH